ncbi:MAG: radical SAM/SPASM domain-containing protein [Candidatus Sericytochromatia bacterium]
MKDPGFLQQYSERVEAMRKSPYLDFPHHIHLETLSLCPAACSFCPYPGLERKGSKMDDSLIDKLFSDLADMPKNLAFQFSPQKVNEPFMDTRLEDLLRKINRRLPQAVINLTTNATPLTEARLLSLTEISNINYLWISVNESEPEAYARTMQLSWDLVQSRLRMVHKQLAKGKLNFEIVLSRVGDGSTADQAFRDWVHTHYPLFRSSVFQRGSWLGQIPDQTLAANMPEVPDLGCTRWFDLSITSEGVVAHCCMDGKAEWPIGDIRTHHALEIYNQPAWRRLRESVLSRREVAPCNGCTFL